MRSSGKFADEGFHDYDSEPHTHKRHRIFCTWFVIADFKKPLICRKGKNDPEHVADADGDENNWDAFDGHTTKVSSGHERKNFDSESRRKYNHEDMGFIHSAANRLDIANNENLFDRLVLVANPKTLGHARESLIRNIHDRVTEEVSKDITKLSLNKIIKHLDHIIV